MSAVSSQLSRRALLASAAGAALLSGCAHAGAASQRPPRTAARPLPLADVRLKPSPFLTAVEANRAYLMRLEPDRLLHNFRVYADLAPKAEAYGGWEADTISGHTLGHYLSACSLMHAQTGDAACKERALYIVDELRACQAGDGYVAGITRKGEGGRIESGRRVFEEVARGDIRPAKFYLNGSWAPLYNWHKLLAGLLDADLHCAAPGALDIAAGIGRYLEATFAPLTDAQMQSVLECEHGGISDSFAELSARTGDPRWLALSQDIYHRRVLAPLADGADQLAHIHANTQIPKLIAQARLHQLTGDPRARAASRFFWDTVVGQRTYVIGGNSDREYFQEPHSISRYITEQTCESCNTYNMLKLTRLLYQQQPRANYFDFYERAHLNHMLAHQRPRDGAFAYMVPLMSGAAREWSEPFGSFWCCVGTGMETHSKHGDSIYWQNDAGLIVNLFIASELIWRQRNARISMDTAYPHGEQVALRVDVETPQRFAIALRIPAWCTDASATLNGAPVRAARDANGYLALHRTWRAGDVIVLTLPMALRFEATPDDPDTIALMHGPLALAADLGPSTAPYSGPPPALVGESLQSAFIAQAASATYRSAGVGRPNDLTFAPFYSQYDQRTAVYFKRYTPAQWAEAQRAFAAEEARRAALAARSIDVIELGTEADEQRHNLTSEISYPVSYRFRPGRDARTGGFFEFDMAVGEGPLILQAAYWGGERERAFRIQIDGADIAAQRLNGEHAGEFIEIDYPIPPQLTAGKRKVRVRFQPDTGFTAGPAFGCRIYRRA